MKSIVTRLAILTALGLSAVVTAGCSDDNVDSNNNKTISDLDIGSDLSMDKGTTKQVTATLKYADGTTLDVTRNSDLKWNIGNTDVATISASGLVTGVAVGATTIKATYQGKESTSHALIVK